MKKRPLFSFLFAIGLLTIWSCQKESIAPTAETAVEGSAFFNIESIEDLVALERELDAFGDETVAQSHSRSHARRVYVKGGTHNALQKAIDKAGAYGTVILGSGEHYVDETVWVRHPVHITGRKSAKIISDVPIQPTVADTIKAVFHILDTERVLIWGLHFEAKGDASGTAIIVENSSKVFVSKNTIDNFQIGVLTSDAEHVSLWRNTLNMSNLWQAGAFQISNGILPINGAYHEIVSNKVANAAINFFMSGTRGKLVNNESSGSFIGVALGIGSNHILLTHDAAADAAGSYWSLLENHSHDHLDSGYFLAEGANNNILKNNRGGGNGRVDIELTGNTQRFGALFDATFENRAYSSKYPEVIIKDCGKKNVVIGGTQIDTNIDPCF